MSIKKGDMLITESPYDGKKKKYKYLGLIDKNEFPTLYANGFKRMLIDREGNKIIVTNLWAKTFNLKPVKKNG
jgi:hypothetical protein